MTRDTKSTALRVVSWNIGQVYFPAPLRPYWGDGHAEPHLIPGVIAALDALAADVIFLQEVSGASMLDAITQGLGAGFVGQLADVPFDRQLAVVHRLGPDWRVSPYETGVSGAYTRALVLEGSRGGQRVRLIGVHATGASPTRRARYFDGVMDLLDDTSGPPFDLDVVTGDFNIVDEQRDATDSTTLRWLGERMRDSDPARRPTFLGVVRLDYLFYRCQTRGAWWSQFQVIRDARRGLQDHDPIAVDLIPTD